MGYFLLRQELKADNVPDVPFIAIPVDEFDVGYSLKDKLEREYEQEIVSGTLAVVCETASIDQGGLLLLSTVLEVVAEAWGVPRAVLEDQVWRLYYKKNALVSLLTRPEPTSSMPNSDKDV
jgi:hypothetical protein